MSIIFKSGSKDRETAGIVAGVGGKVREVKEVYAGRNGKPELVWSRGISSKYIYVTGNNSYYSNDLITWKAMKGEVLSWRENKGGVVAGEDAVINWSSGENTLKVSKMGTSWVTYTDDEPIRGVVYGKDIFLKINHTLNNADIKISTSTDGLNWSSKVTLTQSGDNRYIEPYLYYLNNEFVIVEGGDGNVLYTSGDGVKWDKRTNYNEHFSDNNGTCEFTPKILTYGKGIYAGHIYYKRGQYTIAYCNSLTGKWQAVKAGYFDLTTYDENPSQSLYANGRFFIMIYRSSGNNFSCFESSDGTNFNEIDGLNGFQSVAFDGNRFIGIKFDGTIYTKNAAYTGSWEQAGTLPEAGRRAGVGIYYTGK